MPDRDELLADLLMGAAHADRELDGRELATVRELLAQAMRRDAIPPEIEARLSAFDPAAFQVDRAVEGLGLRRLGEKLGLLQLIAAVNDADDVLDFAEDDYLREVAAALAVPPEAFADLSLEYDLDRLSAAGDSVLRSPPSAPR